MKKKDNKPNTFGGNKGSSKSSGKSKQFRGRNRENRVDTKGSRDVGDCKDTKKGPAGYSALNDVSWYSRNPELLAAAARIPFPYKPGMNIDPGSTKINQKDTSLKFMIPGVCVLKYAYSIGHSQDVTSPASIAAKEMYARIRAKFSGSLDADAPDIMMYSLALDNIHAYIAWLKRLYRIITMYTAQNRLLPDTLVQAIGVQPVDLEDLQARKVEFWGKINTLVNMVNKFRVPDDMDLYHRHRWMNENVYLDEPMPNSQMYVFNPLGYWVVKTDASTGTSLKFTNMTAQTNVDGLYNYGKAMIDALSNWDDSYTINGYMERAFEGANWYTAELLNQDEVLIPVYEPEVLAQIENFTGIGTPSNLDVTQDPTTNVVKHTPTAPDLYDGSNVLNLHVDAPTAADVTVATRLMAHTTADGSVIAGTEIPISVSFVFTGSTGEIETVTIPYMTSLALSNLNTITSWANKIEPFLVRSSFDHAPMAWLAVYTADNSHVRLVGNMSNPTTISDSQLDELTRVCIYSEFNCFR